MEPEDVSGPNGIGDLIFFKTGFDHFGRQAVNRKLTYYHIISDKANLLANGCLFSDLAVTEQHQLSFVVVFLTT